jgi:sugar phosphate isomerase/epimerase
MKRMPAFLATAQAIGCEILETVVRPGSQARPYHENFELHRQRLSELAEALDQFGMRLGIAFQAAAADRQGYAYSFISTPDALLTLLKTTVAANLGVVVDSWQWTLGGGTFDQLRDLTATQITEVRLADLPPDVTSETARNEQRLLPGTTGRVDTVSLLRMLGQMGYTGPLTPYPHAAQFAGKKREETVHLAGASLDRQLALAGVAVGRPAPLHVGVLR